MLRTAIGQLDQLCSQLEDPGGRIHLRDGELLIDNPRARGALTVQMMCELAGHVLALEHTDLGVLIIRGTAQAFCSGGHLSQVRRGLIDPEKGRLMGEAMTVVLDGLASLPCVVVAAVDGPALGGGAELLTAVDHRVFGENARVGFVHGKLGVTPGWGATARLVRLLGPTEALRWMTSAQIVGGSELGRFSDASGPLDATLKRFLSPLRELQPEALQALKRALLSESPLMRTGGELDVFGTVWGGDRHRAALAR